MSSDANPSDALSRQDFAPFAGSAQPNVRAAAPGLSRIGRPAATATTAPQAAATSRLSRPCQSRKSRPSGVAGDDAQRRPRWRPESPGRRVLTKRLVNSDICASSSRPASIRLLSHRVRQSTSTTRPGRASARSAAASSSGSSRVRQPSPAFAAMAGDALRHLGVAGLGGGEIEPFRGRRPRRAPARSGSCPNARRRSPGRSGRRPGRASLPCASISRAAAHFNPGLYPPRRFAPIAAATPPLPIPRPRLSVSLDQTLRDWRDFYVMGGTAAATLVGLMFVFASIGASRFSSKYLAPMRAFITPTVVHFARRCSSAWFRSCRATANAASAACSASAR